MKHIKLFEDFVNEALSSKKPNEIITIDLDMVWNDSNTEEDKATRDAFKKYNIKVKEVKSNPGTFNVTGKKKDILGYLQSEFYEMDADDIKEFYPELLEGNSVNENVYPSKKDGEISAFGRSEEIGRIDLKSKGNTIGTLLVWMQPKYDFNTKGYDENYWEVGASYTSYPLSDPSGSTGTGVWSLRGYKSTKEEAVKAGEEFMKSIKLS